MAVSDDLGACPGAVRCDVTLPCDARFRTLRERVVERLVGSLGCAGTAAARAVTLATGGVFDHPAGAVYSSVAITFTAGAGVLTADMRYLVGAGAPEPGPPVESILGAGGPDAPLASLRRLAVRVEFGRTDGAECCTLVTPLGSAPDGDERP